MFRRIVFWIHLALGLSAGAIIALLCATGVILAFEQELIAWWERDARRVEVPVNASRVSVDHAAAQAAAQQGGAQPTAITVLADPSAAITVAFGRDDFIYVNPYTGEARRPASLWMRQFMKGTVEWHRWLARKDASRDTGKAITGAANLVFLFLALSGLYLWWPRQWSSPGQRASWRFIGAKGRARDWNWHNVIGFWSLPVLIVLTVSGAVIGYRWAGDLVFTLAGETPPPRQGPGAGANPGSGPNRNPAGGLRAEKPTPDAKPLMLESLVRQTTVREPDFREITVRTQPANRGSDSADAGFAPYTLTVKPPHAWPATATLTYSINPYTGSVLKRESFGDLTPGRQARTWLRFLHTGQALGWPGQLVAGLASAGGVVLVYTGLALTWRRFFRRRSSP